MKIIYSFENFIPSETCMFGESERETLKQTKNSYFNFPQTKNFSGRNNYFSTSSNFSFYSSNNRNNTTCTETVDFNAIEHSVSNNCFSKSATNSRVNYIYFSAKANCFSSCSINFKAKNHCACTRNTRRILRNTSAILKNTSAILKNTSAILRNTSAILRNTSVILRNTRAILKCSRSILSGYPVIQRAFPIIQNGNRNIPSTFPVTAYAISDITNSTAVIRSALLNIPDSIANSIKVIYKTFLLNNIINNQNY